MTLDRSNTVICIVDMQERLVRAMNPEVAERVTKNAAILAKGAKALGVPVLYTQQYTKGLGETVDELRAALEHPHIEKITFSCCRTDAFNEALGKLGARTVVLAGAETHVCVLQTALDLLDQGIDVHVAVDAVMSQRRLAWETALRQMERAGAVLTVVETLLFHWLERADTPEFKEVSRLVK